MSEKAQLTEDQLRGMTNIAIAEAHARGEVSEKVAGKFILGRLARKSERRAAKAEKAAA